MKKTDLFDKLMREKLEAINPPANPKHWDLFSQQLDEGALEEEVGHIAPDSQRIDESVFEKLHQYEVPYNPAHWNKMDALLNEVFAWPTQVLKYKATELALMLLVFTFFWQSTADSVYQSPAPDFPIASNQQSSENAILNPSTAPSLVPENSQKESSYNQQDLAAIPVEPSTDLPINFRQRTTAAPSLSAVNSTIGGKTISGNSTLANTAIALLSPNLKHKTIATKPYSLPPSNKQQPLLYNQSAFESFDILDTKLTTALSYKDRLLPENTNPKALKRKGVLRLGMYGSGEYNHIMVRPSQEKSNAETLDRFAIGYGSGVTIGYDLGRWEIETGAAYASRRYPVGLVYVQGSLQEGYVGSELRAGELNIINVPLHLRYNFIKRREWRAYAITGAALQMAFQANYYAVESPEFSFSPRPTVPGPPPMAPGTEESSITRIKKESIGLLEGGAFNDNAYITGNMGFGVERYVNDRWSLYVQPTYQYSLHYFREGLGPNRDHLNSLSFLFGTKVRMW